MSLYAHKGFDGVALGVPVYLAQLSPARAWGALCFCAAMTPLGIGVGWAAAGAGGGLGAAVISALTGGSFLFISLCELLPAALHDGKLAGAKMGAFMGGFAAMAALAIVL